MGDKETKKLNAEELEKRVAPGTLYVDDGGSGTETESPKGQKAPGKDAKV